MNRVLITGIAGFIGSSIAKRFIAEGWNVTGIDNLSTGLIGNVPKEADFIETNVCDISLNSKFSKLKPKLILHLAGQSSGEISYENPSADLSMNTLSTLELIKFAIQSDCSRMLYASSMSVYGTVNHGLASENLRPIPISCYGISKYTSEMYLNLFKNKLNSTCLRMFNVYGPNQDLNNLKQGMVSIYLAQALKNRKIFVKGGLQRYRDFIYIDDVVELWWRLGSQSEFDNLPVINIGTGIKTSVADLIQEISANIPNVEIEVLEGTMGDQFGVYADTKVLNQAFGKYNFINLNDGLRKFIDWSILNLVR